MLSAESLIGIQSNLFFKSKTETKFLRNGEKAGQGEEKRPKAKLKRCFFDDKTCLEEMKHTDTSSSL